MSDILNCDGKIESKFETEMAHERIVIWKLKWEKETHQGSFE